MKSVVFVLLAGIALVRGQASSLIPTTISPGCSTYLTSLNADAALSACTQPLLAAASAFSPSSSSSSSSSLTSTLQSLCSTPLCPATTIRSHLAAFYAACSAELTATTGNSTNANAGDETVRDFYDVLYVVTPLREAVCSTDNSTGGWCVQEIAKDAKAAGSSSNSTGAGLVAAAPAPDARASAIALAQSYLSYAVPTLKKRDASSQSPFLNETTLLPNSTTFATTSLAYLFLLPSLPASLLCTPCTRAVLSAYISWEQAVPYALGLSNSPILGGQAALWQGVGSTCGSGFLSGVEQNVGGVLSLGSSLSGAVGQFAGIIGTGVVSVGAMALAALFL